jgi:tetratricopeptide (TPR) repeat protein
VAGKKHSIGRIVRRSILALLLGAWIGGGAVVFLSDRPGRLPISHPSTSPAAARPAGKYDTFAHRCLAIDAQRFPVPAESYQLLDRIIDQVKQRTHVEPAETSTRERRRQVAAVLKTIDEVCIDEGFYYPGEWQKYDGSVAMALEPRHLPPVEVKALLTDEVNERRRAYMRSHPEGPFHSAVCVQSAMLYAGVGEAAGLDVRLVSAPGHVFVRARLAGGGDDEWLNWETTSGCSMPDEQYKTGEHPIYDWQVAEGIHLRTLSLDEGLSYAYSARGTRCSMSGRAVDAAQDYQRAMALNPKALSAIGTLAALYATWPGFSGEQRQEAPGLARAVIAMEPRVPYAHAALAAAAAELGDFRTAIDAQRRAAALSRDDPKFAEPIAWYESGRTATQVWRAQHAPVLNLLPRDGGDRFILATGLGLIVCGGVSLLLRVVRQLLSAE